MVAWQPIAVVPVSCTTCEQEFVIHAPVSNLMAWVGGEWAQSALWMLTPDERELLMSNTCGACWEDMYGEHEDEFDLVFWQNN